MPTYCFKDLETGITQDVIMPIKEMERHLRIEKKDGHVLIDGKPHVRDMASELSGQGKTSGDQAWPLYSDAAGVHPSQIKEMEAVCEKHGVNTKFDRQTGQAIFRTRGHRRAHNKLFGFHDRNGGYGDG